MDTLFDIKVKGVWTLRGGYLIKWLSRPPQLCQLLNLKQVPNVEHDHRHLNIGVRLIRVPGLGVLT
jgi:hypothetical protein